MTQKIISSYNLPQKEIVSSPNFERAQIELDVVAIIPTLNEEKNIGSVVKQTLSYVDSVVVIDGRSEDNTVKIAKETGANIIIQKSRGKGAALKEAFDHVDSEMYMVLDGDGSMRPQEIPLFRNEVYFGADVVKGSRFLRDGGSSDITLLRRLGNTFLLFLVNRIWGTNFTDLCYGFMAFRKDVAIKLSPILRSKGFNIEAEILIKAIKLNLKIKEVPSWELKRLHGRSKLNIFIDGFKILSTILREAIT